MGLDLATALAWAAERKNGVLITIRRDGRPQSSDIAYAVVGDEIHVSLTATRAKTANMRRDERIVLHVTAPDAWSYVSFDAVADLGEVTTAPDDAAADDLVELYRTVAGQEHPDWDEYRQAMIEEQRLVLRIRPNGAVGMING
ncbi:MAG: PPOX class F420-dependent oxidoreductase [Actinomycetota bacterium]